MSCLNLYRQFLQSKFSLCKCIALGRAALHPLVQYKTLSPRCSTVAGLKYELCMSGCLRIIAPLYTGEAIPNQIMKYLHGIFPQETFFTTCHFQTLISKVLFSNRAINTATLSFNKPFAFVDVIKFNNLISCYYKSFPLNVENGKDKTSPSHLLPTKSTGSYKVILDVPSTSRLIIVVQISKVYMPKVCPTSQKDQILSAQQTFFSYIKSSTL